MHTALISVALCTYNSGLFLVPLLNSLLGQSYKNIEIVCCDDNSTDGTQQVLHEYQQAHPEKFKLTFNETNLGHVKNFEKVLSLCQGDFIAIADHDDVWKKNKIEKLADAIGNAPLVYSDSIYIDEEGKEMGRQLTTKFNLHDKPDPRSFIFASSVWGHSLLLNKDLLKVALPIPANAPYDTWLAYTAASTGHVKYLPEPLTYWRQHPASYSAGYYEQKEGNKDLRYHDCQELKSWITIMKDFPGNKHTIFFSELSVLYQRREKGSFVWPLYFFLVKHRKHLFKVWKRSYLSSLNEFRKMARGVKRKNNHKD